MMEDESNRRTLALVKRSESKTDPGIEAGNCSQKILLTAKWASDRTDTLGECRSVLDLYLDGRSPNLVFKKARAGA